MNEYLKLVDEAHKKRLKLTNDQIYQIKNMYNDISRDLIARARAAAPKVRIERMRSPEMIEASPDECSGWRGFAVINGP